jgi:PAS domain-containing protein
MPTSSSCPNEYRRTERQLQETENRYRTLVEGMPAVLFEGGSRFRVFLPNAPAIAGRASLEGRSAGRDDRLDRTSVPDLDGTDGAEALAGVPGSS